MTEQLKIEDVTIAAKNRGLKITELAGFWKYARRGKAVYVGKSKAELVTRVDISGVELEHDAVKPPKAKNGRVTGQINMSHDEALDALEQALDLVAGKAKGTKTEATAQ